MGSRFVQPDMVRLPLSGGDYLDIKRRLTAGEERRILARCVQTFTAGEKPTLDAAQVGRTRILEYVIDWGGPGFVDGQGKPVPWSEAALDNLDGDSFREIDKAIDDHEKAEDRARSAEKNAPAGESKPVPTSPSAG